MAAFPPGAVQERRWCALFWAVSTCGCAAADAQFHAQEIRRAHLWARFANGARIEILDLSSAGALRLPRPPRVMECFDISNISTTHVVASMVCFRDGVPVKDNYRRYRVRTVAGQDDFASMAEVVRRRYSRILLEAREANAEASEFSQENAFDAAQRLER